MKKITAAAFAALFITSSLAFAATEAEIIAKEKATWDAWKAKDEAAFKKLVAPEFREISSDRIDDLSAALASMKSMDLESYSMSDTKAVFPDPDTAVLTYKVTLKGKSKGEAFSATYNAGAVWRKMGGDWKLVFYADADPASSDDNDAGAEAQKKESE